jgi:predicted phage terminase large subunit-like protein
MSAINERMVRDALLRSDFRYFLQKAFATLSPGQRFYMEWHLEAIAHALERVRRGEITRLIINMPPRSLKSTTASAAFPAWLLGHEPEKRIICVSYASDLARKMSNDFRAIMQSPWYQRIFPATRISPHKDTESEMETTRRGYRYSTSIGGTLTGRGGDIVLIDDPLKAVDALSETKRGFVNQWFANTLSSRLDDKRSGAIILVMQRVHMDDLTGYVQELPDQWEVLSLPAIAETSATYALPRGRLYHREIGEALSPIREPLEVLNALRMQLGSDLFSAQYQQEPIPPGGTMIKRHWVKRYTELPSEHCLVLQSWDTASKGGPENDYSVCTTWMMPSGKKYWYLADVWRGRVDYPGLKAKAQALAKTWTANRVLVEDTGAGTSLVQELKGSVSGIIAVKPQGDKVSRMAVASAKFEAGQIYFPERAPWLAELEAELFAFPGHRHDDQCDSISQALLNTRFPLLITAEMLEGIRRPPHNMWMNRSLL